MPYDFETMFVQPLLADLDAGAISGAEAWSSAIVKYYSMTVKAGLPQGVPPSLPAPGLNPTAPPPYPINVIGISNNPNEKAMKEIIKAFFLAKEIANDKAAVRSLVNTVTQLVEKIKVRRKEALELIENIKKLALEVKNVPQYIKEVIDAVKEIVEEDKNKVKALFELMDNFKAELSEQLTAEDFQRVFKEELDILNTLKNFKIQSFDDLTSIVGFIDGLRSKIERFSKSRGNAAGGTARGVFFEAKPRGGEFDIKLYLYSRIGEILVSIEQLANIVLDPPNFLAYVERLRTKSPKFDRAFLAVSKLDAVERYVKPQILKLEKLKDQKIKEIKEKVQPKIDEVKKKLEEKIQELLSKRKEGLKDNLYTKTKKRVTDFKKTHGAKIKRVKNEIKLIEKAIKQLNLIVEKSKTLKSSLETEFEIIKSELILLRDNAKEGVYVDKFKDIQDDLKKALAKSTKPNIIKDATGYNPILPTGNSPNPLDNPPRLTSVEIKQEYLAQVERNVGGPGDLERTRALRRELKNDIVEEPNADQVYLYMEQLGLGDFSQVVLSVISESKTSLDTFKLLFERRLTKYKAYIEEIETLIGDIKKLFDILQDIREGKGPAGKAADWAARQAASLKNSQVGQNVGRWLEGQAASLKELMMDLVKKVEPLINKARSWIQKQYKKAKKFIEEKVAKFEKEIEWYLLKLVPLGSDKKDFETKQIEIEARKLKVDHYKKQIQYYSKLSQAIGKAARGGVALQKSIFTNNQYSLAANERHIKNITDGVFDYKKLRANNDPTISAALDVEKKEFLAQMADLTVIEMTVYGLIEFFKVVTNGKEYLEDWDRLVASIEDTTLKPALDALTAVYKNPPKDPRQIINLVEDTMNTSNIFNLFTKTAFIDGLVALEQKHLGRVREVLKSLTDARLQEAVENTASGKISSKNVFSFLEDLSDILNNKKSFVKFLLEKLEFYFNKLVRFIKKEVDKIITDVKKYIAKKLKKIKEEFDIQLEKIKEKAVNLEAPVMSITFGLAARIFWTGATWPGPTGTQHIVFNVGQFVPMKALTKDGASGFVKEMARGFEAQLKTLQGLATPPPNTGIPPIPFTGYK